MKTLIQKSTILIGLVSVAVSAQTAPPPPPSAPINQQQGYQQGQNMMMPNNYPYPGGGQYFNPSPQTLPGQPPVGRSEVAYDPNTGCPIDDRFQNKRLTGAAISAGGGIHFQQ